MLSFQSKVSQYHLILKTYSLHQRVMKKIQYENLCLMHMKKKEGSKIIQGENQKDGGRIAEIKGVPEENPKPEYEV